MLISIIFGLLLRAIARKRGANQIFWFVMGFVFGPFVLPFVFLARRKHDLESLLHEKN
jgi:hypothetical protein